ncbi:MAG: PilN domain-containing protein [Phycisphaerae bacterium]|nr:PilN domain-containing protein [Phycisphaerae bacterium]
MKKKIDIKLKPRMAVGLELSSSSVALACLRQDKHGIHLVRAVRQPIPESLIKNGLTSDPKRLRKIFYDLKRTCGSARTATLSLYSPRSLVQIMDVPNEVSMNLGQYVQKEIKHYVNLAGAKTVSDYRSLDSTEESRRVFVAVGDHKSVASAVNACQSAGFDVQAVEPSLVAYIRALYDRTLAHQSACNVVLAMIQNDQVCLAVWQDRALHFIRSHSLEAVKDDAKQRGVFLANKIKTIMQYYELEVGDRSDVWKINVVTDDASSFPESASMQLCEAMGETSVDVITSENLELHCPVEISQKIPRSQVSIGAIGYAMQALSSHSAVPKVNLLPMQIREEKEVKQGMLLTAIAASVMMLFSALATIGIATSIKKVNSRILIKKPLGAVGQVVKARSEVESQIEQVGKIPTQLKSILASQESVNWPGVLSDINNSRPKGVCLTSVDTRNKYEVYIQGKALTYSDVTSYVTRLSQTVNIASANLAKTDHKGGYNSHHVYEIKCQLKTTVGI